MKFDYNSIKRLAKELRETGETVTAFDLLALTKTNDPFYVGTPAQIKYARWFAELWERLDLGYGVHLREVHYTLISQREQVKLPTTLTGISKETGERFETDVYLNEDRTWQFMCLTSKWARYLDLVPYEAISDHRVPAIREYAVYDDFDGPYVRIWRDEDELTFSLPDLPDAPSLQVGGYRGEQPYHIEVWIEKSTQNKHLDPLCKQYGVNLVSGEGHMSLTLVVDFIKRVELAGKPARILYISDYDQAGRSMPVAVARKIEFFQRNQGYDVWDIKLDAVALTKEQIEQYDLPSAPDSDKVELDALQVNYPGLLRELTEAAILNYYDRGLRRRVDDVEQGMERILERLERETRAALESRLHTIQAEYDSLRLEFAGRVEGIKNRLELVYDELHGELDEVGVDLEPCPEAEVEGDVKAMLYESGREYFDQLTHYQKQKSGD